MGWTPQGSVARDYSVEHARSELVGIAAEQGGNLGLDGLRLACTRLC